MPAGASRRGRLAFWATLAAVILAGAAVITVVAVVRARSGPQLARPTGIPASVSNAQINLMGLSPVPVRPAPIVHTSAVYFIDPAGRERFIAAPMADHTSSGASYLPAGQITAWGQGIAQVARTLAR